MASNTDQKDLNTSNSDEAVNDQNDVSQQTSKLIGEQLTQEVFLTRMCEKETN